MTAEISSGASGADLHRLAVERPELRAEIARHPALYPDLRNWLAGLGDPAVDAALTARAAAPDAGESDAGESAVRPRPRTARTIGLILAAVVAAGALLVGGIAISNIPRYPASAPHSRDDLDALLRPITIGDLHPQSRASRADSVEEITGARPTECGILRGFGISMFAPDEIATSEDYDVRAGASSDEDGPRWLNGRVFVDDASAVAYLDRVATAVIGCTSFSGLSVSWNVEPVFSSTADVAFRTSTDGATWLHWILARRDNLVVVGSFGDSYRESAANEFVTHIRTGALAD